MCIRDRPDKEPLIKAIQELNSNPENTLYVGDSKFDMELSLIHIYSYKRLIAPSIEREIRTMLTERAEEEAIKVFGKNTKNLLMVPPVKDIRILAIDPSFRTG